MLDRPAEVCCCAKSFVCNYRAVNLSSHPLMLSFRMSFLATCPRLHLIHWAHDLRTMVCQSGACIIYSFFGRLIAYFAVLAILVMISFIILKFIGECREAHVNVTEEGENNPLLCQHYTTKLETSNYGTCQQDLELGNSSSSNSGNNNCVNELYDAKICVICYDGERNSFFVPCGHRATCHVCAKRIFYEENRNCPVCRRLIGKVRRLFDC